MNKLRNRLLKSKLYLFPIFALIGFAITYLLSSTFGKAKPIEKFSIFITGIDFDRKTLAERIYSYKTEQYDYLLVFETVIADEDDDSLGNYDYRFNNEAIPNSDIIIYPQTYFESTFPLDAYQGHFNPINNTKSSWVMPNEYALQIHDKNSDPKDDILGITFGDDNYLISINKKTVHDSIDSDAARHFIEAFIHYE